MVYIPRRQQLCALWYAGACPFEVRTIMMMGNSLMNNPQYPVYSVPRMVYLLAPFFGVHALVDFTTSTSWRICTHAVYQFQMNQGYRFQKQMKSQGSRGTHLGSDLVGSSWDEGAVTQPFAA